MILSVAIFPSRRFIIPSIVIPNPYVINYLSSIS